MQTTQYNPFIVDSNEHGYFEFIHNNAVLYGTATIETDVIDHKGWIEGGVIKGEDIEGEVVNGIEVVILSVEGMMGHDTKIDVTDIPYYREVAQDQAEQDIELYK